MCVGKHVRRHRPISRIALVPQRLKRGIPDAVFVVVLQCDRAARWCWWRVVGGVVCLEYMRRDGERACVQTKACEPTRLPLYCICILRLGRRIGRAVVVCFPVARPANVA